MKEMVQFNIMLPKALVQRLRAQREAAGLTWEEFLTAMAARDDAARRRRTA